MKIKILIALSFSFLASIPANARMMMMTEATHSVSLGAGIANPAGTQAIGENPSGLIYNFGSQIEGFIQSSSSSFNPLVAGGKFFSGNGSVGAGLSFTHDQGDDQSRLGFGLATDARSLGVAVGVSGHYRVSGAKVGNDLGVDVGTLFNPFGQFRLGVTAFDVTNSVTAIGAGLAMDLNRSAVFVVDATSDKALKGLSLKPGLGVTVESLTLTYSYGIQIDKNYSTRVMTLGSSLGLGFALTKNVNLEAYYNQVAKYYVGLGLSI